jgi:hypothetical protein
LWVLGTQQPLPRKLVWRSRNVEALIAQSQELITAGGTSLDVDFGFFGFFSATRAFIRARKIPNGATLDQVLPSRTQSNDRLRPVWAAQELQRAALETSGFAKHDAIAATVRKLAKKHRLEITSPLVEVELKLDAPGALFDRIGQLDIEDAGCFERTLDELEGRLERRRERANAWASGDIGELHDLYSRREEPECMRETVQAMMTAGSAGTTFGPLELVNWIKHEAPRARAEARRRWLEAAENALERNRNTFALLPMFDVVNPAGWLQALRDKGYTVEPPRDAGLDHQAQSSDPGRADDCA